LDHTNSHHAHARILDSEIIAQQHLVSPQNTTHATLTRILAPCTRAHSCAFMRVYFPMLSCLAPAQLPALHVYHCTIIPTLTRSSPNNLSIIHALHMRHSCIFLRLACARTFLRLALSVRLSHGCRDMEWTTPALRFTPGPTSNMTSIMRLLLHAPWQFMLCASSHSAFPRFAHHHSARSCAITAAFDQVHSLAKYCLNNHHYCHLNCIS
jgi:hypothetical protein